MVPPLMVAERHIQPSSPAVSLPRGAVSRGLYLSELLPGVGPSPEVCFVLAKSDCHQCVATVIKYGPVVLRRERVKTKSVCLHVELLTGEW